MIRNVVEPTLTPYLPDPEVANGTGLIIAPGGGFFYLSWDHEGTRLAARLRDLGVTCFLLKYRLTDSGTTEADFQACFVNLFTRLQQDAGAGRDNMRAPLLAGAGPDGIRALEIVRERAAEWNLDPSRIGFLGFSAGAFLTTYVATEAPQSARPDFIAPIYGGDAPAGSVQADAPPLFCVVAADDLLCYDGCMNAFQAWRAAGAPAELHVYARGGHGFGMNRLGQPADGWVDRLTDWMTSRGYLR
jgi:acetyl esterase/lipase